MGDYQNYLATDQTRKRLVRVASEYELERPELGNVVTAESLGKWYVYVYLDKYRMSEEQRTALLKAMVIEYPEADLDVSELYAGGDVESKLSWKGYADRKIVVNFGPTQTEVSNG